MAYVSFVKKTYNICFVGLGRRSDERSGVPLPRWRQALHLLHREGAAFRIGERVGVACDISAFTDPLDGTVGRTHIRFRSDGAAL